MRLLIAYGTRPEYIKIKPLLREMGRKVKLLFTGQHGDIIDDASPDQSLSISTEGNRLDSIVKSILGHDEIFKGVDKVMVQGDTASAFAVALAAFHRKIPIVHLEAGLRTYDMTSPYPEELYRVAIDRMSSILLCPTKKDKDNLIREGIQGDIHVTGNTGLDNLRGIKTNYYPMVLCTMHRRENHGMIKGWFSTLKILSEEFTQYQFILPLHPNPNVQAARKYLGRKIEIRDPMSHEETIEILRNCTFVITDSGGIQEEASFLKKRTFVCRTLTERTACLGKSSVQCPYPDDLYKEFKAYQYNFEIRCKSPYGDGQASKRVVEILK